jgi:methyl-accepting chemotaxis protein
MFGQLPPFSRRKGDLANQARSVDVQIVVEVGVEGLKLDEQVPANATHRTSLVDYGSEVSSSLKALTDALQVVSAQRVLKIHRFREMIEHLNGLQEFVDNILGTAHETKLISLNTLISASRCGFKGQSLAAVVNEVSGICDQSEKYLGEIEESVADTRNTINNVMSVVNSTIENDYNLFTVVKGQIDHYIGKLVAAEELLSVMVNDSLEDEQVEQLVKQFQEKMERDVQNLGNVLATALKHLKRLSNRLGRRGIVTANLDEAACRIAALANAHLELKIR